MNLNFPRMRFARFEDPFGGEPPSADELACSRDWAASLAAAERGCCCPAKPVVVAVMPVTDHRPRPVDLRLCAHHYRVSREALLAADAIVFDEAGMLVTL